MLYPQHQQQQLQQRMQQSQQQPSAQGTWHPAMAGYQAPPMGAYMQPPGWQQQPMLYPGMWQPLAQPAAYNVSPGMAMQHPHMLPVYGGHHGMLPQHASPMRTRNSGSIGNSFSRALIPTIANNRSDSHNSGVIRPYNVDMLLSASK